jgi:ABC-type multidrug transport system fused ATPase/permease subunit
MNGRSTMDSATIPTVGVALDGALAIAGLGFAAALIKALGGVGAAYGQAQITGRVGAELRQDVLDRLLCVHPLRRPRQDDHGVTGLGGSAAGVDRVTTHGTGKGQGGADRQGTDSATSTDSPSRRVAALTSSIRDVEIGLHSGVLGGLRALAQLLPLLGILFWLAPTLALAALAVFAPFAILLGSLRRAWKEGHAAAMRESEHLYEAADEAVRHADLWRSYGAEAKARRNVASLGEAIANLSARLEARAAAMTGANEVLGALALVCALFAARAGWLGATTDGGKILGFAVAFFLAYRPIRDLTEARLAWLRGENAFEEIEALAPRDPGPEVASPVAGEWDLAALHLQGLELARGAMSPVTLSVGPGEIVALLGPTGAGKTTLLRTLLGLEAARGGTVDYAGKSLQGAPAGPAARPFAWVPQDAPLLTDTLAANVALGAKADARDALTPLGAGHLVDVLGASRLGAGGRAVSGGERQWICLARAVATRQPILLLDEPTSGLDPDAQAEVLAAIARLRGERSVLLVTHRPEPLAIADRVVRLAPASLGVQVVARDEVSAVQPAE